MRLRTAIVCFALATAASAAMPAGAAAKTCPKFTVGKANSSSYSNGKLPARRVKATGISCKKVRILARAFQSGGIDFPDVSDALGGWGDDFEISHGGLDWTCRVWWIGGSGPSYKLTCRGDGRRARWEVG